MRGLRGEWEQEHTSRKTTAEREDGLNEGPKHEGLLPAVKVCQTAEEEEETTRAKSKCRDEPLQLVRRDPEILADGRKGNGRGRIRRRLWVGWFGLAVRALGMYWERTDIYDHRTGAGSDEGDGTEKGAWGLQRSEGGSLLRGNVGHGWGYRMWRRRKGDRFESDLGQSSALAFLIRSVARSKQRQIPQKGKNFPSLYRRM